MGQCKVGDPTEPESRVQILPPDRGRTEAIESRRIEVEANGDGHCSDYVACRGGIVQCSGSGSSSRSGRTPPIAMLTRPVNFKATLTSKRRNCVTPASVTQRRMPPHGACWETKH